MYWNFTCQNTKFRNFHHSNGYSILFGNFTSEFTVLYIFGHDMIGFYKEWLKWMMLECHKLHIVGRLIFRIIIPSGSLSRDPW